MIGKLKWEDVYLLWNNESYNFPKILSDPMGVSQSLCKPSN